MDGSWRGWGARLLVAAAGGSGIIQLLGSCTSAPPASEPPSATKKEALTVGYERGTARKACQLNGDFDYGSPTRQLLPLDRQTGPRGARNFDLGYPVRQGHRLWFLFGDIFDDGAHANDPIGFTEIGDPAVECPRLSFTVPKLDFGTAENGFATKGVFRLKLTGESSSVATGPNQAPMGGVFDEIDDRFLVTFTASAVPRLPGSDPDFSQLRGVLAEAPRSQMESGGGEFTQVRMTPLSNERFLVQVPEIAAMDEGLGLPDAKQPGGDPRVLLLFGTGGGGSLRRGRTIYLAATRMKELADNRWFFWSDGRWSTTESDARPLFDEEPIRSASEPWGCIGEFSASFDAVTKRWMIMYVCSEQPIGRAGAVAGRAGVRLRMATKPNGPWSPPTLVYSIPRSDLRLPDDDPGPGRLFHEPNQRVFQPAGDGPLERILIPGAIVGQENENNQGLKPPFSCANPAAVFPSYCAPNPVQDVNDPFVGCCTDSTRCCDFAFDQVNLPANDAGFLSLGSGTSGGPYGAYLVTPYTKILSVGDGVRPTTVRLYFTLSTFNPYIVNLMRADVGLDDEDGDGVVDAADHCPKVYDPLQENCNAETERAWNEMTPGSPVEIRGDACDPVPCPKFETQRRGIQLADGTLTDCRAPQPYGIKVCIGRAMEDRVVLDHVGASPKDRLTGERGNFVVPGVETTSRFCQQRLPAFDCFKTTSTDETMRDRRSSAEEERGDSADEPWHRVSLTRESCEQTFFELTIGGAPVPQTACLDALGALGRGATWTEAYAAIPPTFSPGYRWRFAEDRDFWVDGGRIPLPSGNPSCLGEGAVDGGVDGGIVGAGTCLNGRLWFNGKTPVGATQPTTLPNGGGEWVGIHGERLANHYEPSAPDKPGARAFGLLPVFHLPPLFRWLPDPPPVWFGVDRFNPRVAVPIVPVGESLYALGEAEELFRVDDLVAPEVAALLRDETIAWASAAEASPYAGSPLLPLAVAVRGDGTDVASPVFERAGRLTTSFRGGGTSDGPPALTSLATPNDARPAPRTEFVTVYSRATGRVFVIGGNDRATGGRLGDVWHRRVLGGPWEMVELAPGSLGNVVSATFSWKDGRLWVVDVDPRDETGRRHRVVRIELETGAMSVVASTDRHDPDKKARYDRRGLMLDHDGNILLWASSTRAQRHRLARIATRGGGFEIARTKRLPRALQLEPFADLNGYRLFYEPSPKQADDDRDPDDETATSERFPETRVDRRLGFNYSKATAKELGEMLR